MSDVNALRAEFAREIAAIMPPDVKTDVDEQDGRVGFHIFLPTEPVTQNCMRAPKDWSPNGEFGVSRLAATQAYWAFEKTPAFVERERELYRQVGEDDHSIADPVWMTDWQGPVAELEPNG